MSFVSNIFKFAEKTINIRRIHTDLIDTFGRKHKYLRISLTEKCNLRCTYCMPECGVTLTDKGRLVTSEEIQRLSEIVVKYGGVTKIRLTGGEPTVRKDIVEVVEGLSSIEGVTSVAMTTNGVNTGRLAAKLKSAGLTCVNISTDTLQEKKYIDLTRRNGLRKVMSSIDSCLDAGIETVKINCVLMKGVNDNEIIDFIELTKDKPLDVRFIELMPFDGNKWSRDQLVTYGDCVKLMIQHYQDNLLKIHDMPNSTSKAWKIDGYKGQLGFITPMTDNFCSGCDRIRFTADGNLKVCLFDNAEVSLRDALREGKSDEEILDIVKGALKNKAKKHAGMDNLFKMKNRPMVLIGG